MRRLLALAAVTGMASLGMLALSPLLLPAGLGASTGTGQTPPSAATVADIPAALLPHYQQAPACAGLPWQIIAAIGKIESDHARFGGAHLDPATGLVSPPIIGPALDGHGYAAVSVPPGGSPWHHDPVWDHAVGPMQFLTATWATWGIDATGDGIASPHNAYDAIATAGRFLCDHRTQLDSISAAVLRYNPSSDYLSRVLDIAHNYGMAYGGEPAPTTPVPIDPTAGGPVLHTDLTPVINFAIAQLGKPYVWGGAGPDSYDCSGLVMAAYATIGVQLPHYAEYQVGYGQPIDWHHQPIQPGDLLFLAGGDPIHNYGHVGIAIDDTHWIDAPEAGENVSLGPLPYAQLEAVRRLVT